GWTLFGIVMTVIVVALTAIYLVFTPERLTPIARQVADKYVACDHEIGEVDLTFFSTFPYFGVSVKDVYLINPMKGAQSDTLLAVPELIASVKLLDAIDGNVYVKRFVLKDAEANVYIASDGQTNFDVFVTDTTEKEETDTVGVWQLRSVGWDEALTVEARTLTFEDEKDTISASLYDTHITLTALEKDHMEGAQLDLLANGVSVALKGDKYADNLRLQLRLPALLAEGTERVIVDGTRLQINEFALSMDGEVGTPCFSSGEYNTNLTVQTGKWQIKPLLALVPAKFTSSLKDIDVDGEVTLSATARGTYSEKSMPLVTARVTLEDGEGSYKPLPYTLRDLTLDADAALDLNKKQPSTVTINKLSAKTKDSKVGATGKVNDLLGDMLLDLQLKLDAHLPDFAYFLPDSMTVTGDAKGTAAAKIRLSDLTNKRLHKGVISADLNLTDIRYEQDSMKAVLPKTKAKIYIPNTKPSRKSVNWARVELETDKIDFAMGDNTYAMIDAAVIRAEAANVLADQQDYFAALSFDALDAQYEDITADLKTSELEAFLASGKTISAKLKTAGLNGRMGEELKAQTGKLALEASARYNKDGENALLKWNPRLKIDLKNGMLNMPERLPEPVIIPSIEFKYSNREMTIDNSRIELGNSDLELKGNVRHIGKWFKHEDILQGELEIISNHCDANQLMAWFSSDSGSEEEKPTPDPSLKGGEEAKSEADPFLVPTDVDLALNTHMKEVVIFNQVAKDLKGGIYVKDGTLILDEVGFVCRAAKLQLTGMYRTPRRNHLYVGFDYHMIDVDIDELLTMIPNLEQMVPMLSSFKGAAEFHLAAETYLNSQYQPKMSTLRGAASLTGKDLVVLDGETFSKISKLLLFNKKTENKIDSINAELTIYKNEIDIYPLCVQMDNYMVALGGRHNTNMTFDYDINVLSPIYLGVNVSGNIDDLKIKLAKCKFAQDFKPHWYQKVDNQSRELRERIKQSMEKNVRIK
ncbi:MAG: AsmA family protein, partial [Paludibacteraceae bacterium]|nr:AsmA family protein [Paludibacteraceae bacterium]